MSTDIILMNKPPEYTVYVYNTIHWVMVCTCRTNYISTVQCA